MPENIKLMCVLQEPPSGRERVLLGISLLTALIGACASDEADTSPASERALVSAEIASVDAAAQASDPATNADSGVLRPASPGPVMLQGPSGPYLVDVTANGTGCAAGSWTAAASLDGTRIELQVAQLSAATDERTRADFADCTVSVKPRETAGLSFALSEFSAGGHAYLDTDVTGFQSVAQYFQGAPGPAVENEKRTNFAGPIDRDYVFTDARPEADLLWSPCGLERDLNVVTRVGVQSSKPDSEGSVHVSRAGNGSGTLSLKLALRSCDEAEDDGDDASDEGRRCHRHGKRWRCRH